MASASEPTTQSTWNVQRPLISATARQTWMKVETVSGCRMIVTTSARALENCCLTKQRALELGTVVDAICRRRLSGYACAIGSQHARTPLTGPVNRIRSSTQVCTILPCWHSLSTRVLAPTLHRCACVGDCKQHSGKCPCLTQRNFAFVEQCHWKEACKPTTQVRCTAAPMASLIVPCNALRRGHAMGSCLWMVPTANTPRRRAHLSDQDPFC